MEKEIIYFLDLFGTAVFAITGALAAGRKRMDIFGVIVLAGVTALGGGTLRDVILGIRPIFWIENTLYLFTAASAGLLTILLGRVFDFTRRGLVHADALGLAVFTVVGLQKAISAGISLPVAIIMGVVTGVAGSIIRDTLSGEVPMIFRKEIYAAASFAGAMVFVLAREFFIPEFAAAAISVIATFTIRIYSVGRKLSLPVFNIENRKN